MLKANDIQAIRRQSIEKKEKEYKKYIEKCKTEEEAIAQLNEENKKLIKFVENDSMSSRFSCPLSVILMLGIFGYAGLCLLPAVAYNSGMKLPSFLESIISEYVLGEAIFAAIVLIPTGFLKEIWLGLTGKKSKYNEALKEIDSRTKELEMAIEYRDCYKKELQDAKIAASKAAAAKEAARRQVNKTTSQTVSAAAVKPTASATKVVAPAKKSPVAEPLWYRDFLSPEEREDYDDYVDYVDEREREELERQRYLEELEEAEEREREEREQEEREREEREREEREREERETEEYLEMLEEQAIFFSDDYGYGDD